jgi:hypothetical protein
VVALCLVQIVKSSLSDSVDFEDLGGLLETFLYVSACKPCLYRRGLLAVLVVAILAFLKFDLYPILGVDYVGEVDISC